MKPVWLAEYGEALVDVAVEAGDALLKWWRHEGLMVEHKHDASPVTQADRHSQEILVAGLRDLCPLAQVVGEESDLAAWHQVDDSQPYWLLDPLDGTKEFVAGSGDFVICMGYVEQGVATWGLIHCPVAQLTVIGAAGYHGLSGAWQIDNQGVCSAIAVNRHADPGVFLGSVRASSREEQQVFDQLNIQGVNVQLKSVGSALKFVEVARGHASGYLRYGPTHSWDVAAGHAIVKGAGGEVIDWSGRDLAYTSQHGAINPSFICIGADQSLREKTLAAARAVGGRLQSDSLGE